MGHSLSLSSLSLFRTHARIAVVTATAHRLATCMCQSHLSKHLTQSVRRPRPQARSQTMPSTQTPSGCSGALTLSGEHAEQQLLRAGASTAAVSMLPLARQ